MRKGQRQSEGVAGKRVGQGRSWGEGGEWRKVVRGQGKGRVRKRGEAEGGTRVSADWSKANF